MQFDPDRLTDIGGGIEKYLIRAWGPVELVLLAHDGSFPEPADLAFLFPPSDLWSAAAIQKNWICRMNERYRRSAQTKAASNAHADTLIEWIKRTRAVADDVAVVYGDRLARLLRATADEMRQAIDWLSARIENPPTRPEDVADLFLTIDQWAWDQYRAALEIKGRADGIPGLEAGRTALLMPAINARLDAGLKVIDDKAWTMRIRRLKIRPGQEDNLMADVLDALRSGPYDYKGREMQPR